MKHVMVTYTGQVQGVGFRATARQIAGNFKVSGWVKNLSSGGVELVIAAEENEIEAYLKAIRNSHLGPKIDREVTEMYTRESIAGDFDIRY